MTLKEQMLARKGSAVHCMETDYRPVSLVTFYPWQAKEWTLPWSRFDALSISDDEESERLELFFPHHHVVAIGSNLRKILPRIRSFELCCLRSLPASYRAPLGLDEPFIEQLEVHTLAGGKVAPPGAC